ncbi:hypothetical protein AAFF_G00204940 [Aldrovandia affinis]|uniref:Uncharacterized protein n=1 Tax=Aldrovandia affinis TaxID=143900 RepID=A0AAD7RHL2_9TELE|nr:hypothetical protein AAFF_G00204940 [Aldrovandia affinis]
MEGAPSVVRETSFFRMSMLRIWLVPLPPAPFWLPGEMRKTIPVQDQRWIASTVFHVGKLHPDVKLWYEPPVPSLI